MHWDILVALLEPMVSLAQELNLLLLLSRKQKDYLRMELWGRIHGKKYLDYKMD